MIPILQLIDTMYILPMYAQSICSENVTRTDEMCDFFLAQGRSRLWEKMVRALKLEELITVIVSHTHVSHTYSIVSVLTSPFSAPVEFIGQAVI